MNALFCVLSLLTGGSSWASTAPATLEREFYLMGTSLDMTLSAPNRAQALEASQKAYVAVKSAEDRLSTWTPRSELSRVNASVVGKPTALSPLLSRDLGQAHSCAIKTGFAFNPWMGPLVQAWGLRQGGKIPSEAEIQAALKAVADNAFDVGSTSVTKRVDTAAFEEGGFGKGAGLDDAIEALKSSGVVDATLNFGGQLSAFGKSLKTVEISDPSDRSKTLLRFTFSEGSVATSGNSEHGMLIQGKRFGHLLDPKTGKPAAYEGSVTIFAPSGADADCMTKIFVKGFNDALTWADQNNIEALIIEPEKSGSKEKTWVVRPSKAWKPALMPVSKDVHILNRSS